MFFLLLLLLLLSRRRRGGKNFKTEDALAISLYPNSHYSPTPRAEPRLSRLRGGDDDSIPVVPFPLPPLSQSP